MSNNKGQSLFEVIVALGVTGLVLLALVAVATISIRNSTFSKNITLATRHSQEAIEWLRAEKTSDWISFANHVNASSHYCLPSLTWSYPVSSNCPVSQVIPSTIFIRRADFSGPSDSNGDGRGDTVTAIVSTSWTDSKGLHDARSSTIFTSWN